MLQIKKGILLFRYKYMQKFIQIHRLLVVIFILFFTVSAMGDSNIYNFSFKDLDDQPVSLNTFKGKVLLIVNTASRCGFTPQYKDLEELYTKYESQGLKVLGFPSNDFGTQEPGNNSEIKKFCTLKYNVTFPMFAKGSVSGDSIQPLFKYLTSESSKDFTGEIKWNFEKFLIDKKGNLRSRFSSAVTPLNSKITEQVESLLKE